MCIRDSMCNACGLIQGLGGVRYIKLISRNDGIEYGKGLLGKMRSDGTSQGKPCLLYTSFLQALPIALLIGTIYGIVRYRRDRETRISRKLFSCAFVCYMTGLVCLVVGLDLMHTFWYNLFYPIDSSIVIDWFGGCLLYTSRCV